MSKARIEVIDQAYKKMDKDNSGLLTVDDLKVSHFGSMFETRLTLVFGFIGCLQCQVPSRFLEWRKDRRRDFGEILEQI